MLDNLFCFVIGFVLGFFFFNMIMTIKRFVKEYTKWGRRKKFREEMEKLHRDFK